LGVGVWVGGGFVVPANPALSRKKFFFLTPPPPPPTTSTSTNVSHPLSLPLSLPLLTLPSPDCMAHTRVLSRQRGGRALFRAQLPGMMTWQTDHTLQCVSTQCAVVVSQHIHKSCSLFLAGAVAGYDDVADESYGAVCLTAHSMCCSCECARRQVL